MPSPLRSRNNNAGHPANPETHAAPRQQLAAGRQTSAGEGAEPGPDQPASAQSKDHGAPLSLAQPRPDRTRSDQLGSARLGLARYRCCQWSISSTGMARGLATHTSPSRDQGLKLRLKRLQTLEYWTKHKVLEDLSDQHLWREWTDTVSGRDPI